MIVAGHIMGKSNIELAAEYDVTPVTIANILRADHAQTLIAEAHRRIRKDTIEKTSENVDMQAQIRELALKRTKEFLEKDVLAENSPFAFIDRVHKLVSTGSERSVQVAPVQVNVQNNQVVDNSQKELKEVHLNRIATALEIVKDG